MVGINYRLRLRPYLLGSLTGLLVFGFVLLAVYSARHAGLWNVPWWLHGIVVATLAAITVGALTRLIRHEAKHLMEISAEVNHNVGNALQILVQRAYMNPAEREEMVDEAIERIRVTVRDVLPQDAPAAYTKLSRRRSARAIPLAKPVPSLQTLHRQFSSALPAKLATSLFRSEAQSNRTRPVQFWSKRLPPAGCRG
jgi:hypothetical protein